MPKFAANLSYLFQEYKIFDRFKAAEDHGFEAIEYQFPYQDNINKLTRSLYSTKLKVKLINAPAGDISIGQKGLAGLPNNTTEFLKSIKKGIQFAEELGCHQIHVMAGVLTKKIDPKNFFSALTYNLNLASDLCAKQNIRVLIEPINHKSIPHYGIKNLNQALNIIRETRSKNIFLQYDLYHAGINGEDITNSIHKYFSFIRHIQIAGVPERNEPDTGTLDYLPIFNQIDKLGYKGWIGCEYIPKTNTSDGLAWINNINND